jgi:hypothetical protein
LVSAASVIVGPFTTRLYVLVPLNPSASVAVTVIGYEPAWLAALSVPASRPAVESVIPLGNDPVSL